MAEYGLLGEVRVVPRTTSLVAAASVSDTELVVDDAGDFTASDPATGLEGGGTLELNGAQLEYTDVEWGTTEDDADTILLAAPLLTGADVDDLVAPVFGGQAAEDWYAVVDLGGGDPALVPLSYAQRAQWPDGLYDPPVPVMVSEDLQHLEDAPGRPAAAGGRVEAWNLDEWDAAGDDADSPGILTYQPRPNSLTVEQNGVRLRNSEFTLVDRLATPLADETVIRSGDKFTAYYLRDPAADLVGVGTNPSASLYNAAVLARPGLLGFWPLSDAPGSSVMTDLSPGAHHGVYGADVTLGEAGLLTGDPDTCALFPDLAAPHASVPFGSWMNVPTFTIEVWIETQLGTSGIMALPNRDTDFRSWYWIMTSGGGLEVAKIESGLVTSTLGPSGVQDADRHYLVATYDGSNLRMYIDGALVKTTAASGDPSTNAQLAIGGIYAGLGTWYAPYYFKGKQSKVAYYSGAEPGAEILNRWTIGSTGAP